MGKDKLFIKRKSNVMNFDFGKETAAVFDDMLDRSIPLYHELQRMIGEIAREYAQDGTRIYDLGCSTGITMESIASAVDRDVELVGVDYSQAMLDKVKEKFRKNKKVKRFKLIRHDLNEPVTINDASVVVLNLTLQFVRPLNRDSIISSIHKGLVKNGCIIMVEKVLGNNSTFNSQFIKFYYDMKKRNGYSQMEITRKREALENVLIPYRLDENKQLLAKNGFHNIDIFYKWYNFCGFIAAK